MGWLDKIRNGEYEEFNLTFVDPNFRSRLEIILNGLPVYYFYGDVDSLEFDKEKLELKLVFKTPPKFEYYVNEIWEKEDDENGVVDLEGPS